MVWGRAKSAAKMVSLGCVFGVGKQIRGLAGVRPTELNWGKPKTLCNSSAIAVDEFASRPYTRWFPQPRNRSLGETSGGTFSGECLHHFSADEED